MDNLSKYFRDTGRELNQVKWPTQNQALFYTALVIAISVLVAAYVGAFDYFFSQGVKWITNRI